MHLRAFLLVQMPVSEVLCPAWQHTAVADCCFPVNAAVSRGENESGESTGAHPLLAAAFNAFREAVPPSAHLSASAVTPCLSGERLDLQASNKVTLQACAGARPKHTSAADLQYLQKVLQSDSNTWAYGGCLAAACHTVSSITWSTCDNDRRT